LGDEWSLLVCDLDQAGEIYLRSLFSQSGTAPLLAFSPARLPKERAALFQYSGVVLSLGAVQAWGDVLLQALTSGRPLIGEETPLVSARVGPAAYLVTPGDARGLGAALITVLIEPDLSEQLCLAAQKRAQGWSDGIDFPTRLDELF
jgi:glycosyltransferase involved in cell wall biosynthesis